jgi:hypothetical protein
MIIWDKNFTKPAVVKEEPVEAPFSVPENAETVTIEIEDVPGPAVTPIPLMVAKNASAGKGFGW